MCLSEVIEIIKKPTKKILRWYKVFTPAQDKSPKFKFYYLKRLSKVPVGRWLKAREVDVDWDTTQPPYTSGFHIYADLAGALYWAADGDEIWEVEGRYVHTVGMQHSHETFVAREMRVLKRHGSEE